MSGSFHGFVRDNVVIGKANPLPSFMWRMPITRRRYRLIRECLTHRNNDQFGIRSRNCTDVVTAVAALAGAPLPYTIPELAELAKHCTAREDAATKVERRVRKSAAALLLSGRIGERFNAFVTGASPKGTWVRLIQPPARGRLERGFHGLDVGDHVHVRLVHTDVERGFINFVLDSCPFSCASVSTGLCGGPHHEQELNDEAPDRTKPWPVGTPPSR